MERFRVRKVSSALTAAGCFATLALMIKYPKEVSVAASEALELCASTVIPTMFPFFAVTAFLVSSGSVERFGRKADRATQKLFNASGKAFGIFALSLISGFPVGASVISSMTDKNAISKKQGARLLSCCVNAGPAFVVGTVGTGMLGSRKAGIILLASLCLSSVTVFVVSGFFVERERQETIINTLDAPVFDFSASLVKSVESATSSMLSVCGWIIAFSSFEAMLMGRAELAQIFLEVTVGCKKAANFPLPVMALVIGWGGACVHCQVFSAVVKTQMKKSLFFFCRLLNGALAACFCFILSRVFPCAVETFASTSEAVGARLSSNSVACAALLMMCAILIIDFEQGLVRQGQKTIRKTKIKKP